MNDITNSINIKLVTIIFMSFSYIVYPLLRQIFISKVNNILFFSNIIFVIFFKFLSKNTVLRNYENMVYYSCQSNYT